MGNAAATPRKPSPVTVHDVELVNLLWQLKQQYQQRSGNCVPLTMLLNDPDYRLSVLQAAADADEPGLAALAAEIAALLEARQTPPRPTPPSAPPSQPARRRLPWWLGASALACLILLAGLALLGPRQAAEETASVAAAAATGPQKKPLPAQLPPPALRLHGSNTIGEQLAPALVEGILRARGYTDIRLVPGTTSTDKTVYAFAQDDLPEIAVEIHAHGSSTAFQGLMAGSADLGMASRPILDREVTALQPQLGNLTAVGSEHVIALDGLAVIVHPSNPVHSLSTRQVAQLFSGQIANWNSLGGPELPVTVYARDDQSGTFETFKSLVLKPHGAQLTPSAHRIESSSELSDRVAQDPGAIGFIGLPYVRRAKVLAINESEQALAIVPTHFTVATEDYPLSRRLYFTCQPSRPIRWPSS
ncbi:MAG: phosphate ABC transporter substrate-binding protein [Xanthomonadaceae bacterium]|nr:phosphate ABC transporter substrate-binding protein [Xanthomonadaceae bacterium]